MADYAGDLSPQDAWELLKSDPACRLVDCRTQAEWSYVGVPDLKSIGKECAFVEWISFPAGGQNPNFVAEVRVVQTLPASPVLFLCRSGVRSIAAATAMTQAGYSACYNVLEGFEGDKDGNKHRGCTGGWKHHGLPWIQS